MAKRVLSILLSTVLTLALVACAGSQETESPPTTESAQTESAASPADAQSTDSEVTLQYFEPHYFEGAIAIDKSIALFNEEYPNIKIEVESVPMADRTAKFIAAMTAGSGPDIVCIGAGGDYMTFMNEGYLVGLNQFTQSDHWDKFHELFVDFATVDGEIYGIPYSSGNYAIMYNKRHYAEAGITELPKTWDEFKDAMRALTRDTDGDGQIDRYGLALSTQREIPPRLLTMLSWTNGGEIVTADGTPVINSDANVEALEWLSSMVLEGLVPPGVANVDSTIEEQQFSAELVSTMIEGNWGVPRIIRADPKFEEDMGFYPIPAPEGKTAQSMSTIAYLAISTDSKFQQEAFWFIDYMSRTHVQLSFVDNGGYLPTTKEAFQARGDHEFYGSFVNSMWEARLLPVYKNDGEVQDLMRLAVQSAFLGTSSAKDALDAAQQTFESLV